MKKIRLYAKAVIVVDGRVLMLRRSASHPTKAGQWDLPGGMAQTGELPHYAMIREVNEETTLWVRMLDVLKIESYHGTDTGKVRTRWQKITHHKVRTLGVVYLAEISPSHHDQGIALSPEHDHYVWASANVVRASNLLPKYQNAALAGIACS